MAAQQAQSLSDVAQSVYSDVEKLISQHLSRLADQAKSELTKAAAAGASFGGGAGLMALGTILGGMGTVHLVHRLTGMPLWLSYATCSAAACAAGAGLFATGAEAVSDIDLVPHSPRPAVRRAMSKDGR